MNPFEPGGGTIPPAPIDIPLPELPAANFAAVGRDVAKGAKDGGIWTGLIEAIVNGLADLITSTLGILLGLVEWVIAKLLLLVFKVFAGAEFGTNKIAATVLGGMTGLTVNEGLFDGIANREGRGEAAAQLVGLLQKALAEGQPAPGAGTLVASSAGAEAFLKLSAHMGIEGWNMGWLCDTFSGHLMEHVGDLKEVVERTLGLGRMARRALSAPMSILVVEPYRWKLLSQYRPTLLGAQDYIRSYLRGDISRDHLDALMAPLGHSSFNINALINNHKAHLAPGDVVNLLTHGSLSDTAATQMLKDQGYDDATAALFIQAHRNNQNDAWARQAVSAALGAYHHNLMSLADFNSVLDGTGLPADEKKWITIQANIEGLHQRKLLSLGEGAQLVERSLWTMEEFRALALAHGYSLNDEIELELLLLSKIQGAQAAADARTKAAQARALRAAAALKKAQDEAANAANIAEAKGVAIAKYELLVKDGLKTIAQYRAFLLGKGIAPDNIDALATVLTNKLNSTGGNQSTTTRLATAAKAKQLNLTQLEHAVVNNHITRAEYQQRVTDAGFTPGDVQILLELLDDTITAHQLKGSTKATATATAKSKGLSMAAEERAVRLGLQTLDQYRAFLSHLGYEDPDESLLVSLLQKQLDADKHARALRGRALSEESTRGLALRDLEKLVRAGTRPVTDYSAALSAAGYAPDAVNALTDLLKLHIEADAQAFAVHGHAAALLAESGVSLSQLEAGVKAGTAELSDYTAQLKLTGLADADVKLLTATLAVKAKIDTSASGAVKQP